MIQIQRILVPVDFSPSCWIALEWADTLARAYGASIELLHVWEPLALASPLEDQLGEQAEAALEQLRAQARQRDIAVQAARAISGRPWQAIVQEAERAGYDIIVIGRHGRSALARVLLGSVAERVVRLAHCPVLVAQPVADGVRT